MLFQVKRKYLVKFKKKHEYFVTRKRKRESSDEEECVMYGSDEILSESKI